jgi:hypothetical protein
MDLYAMDWGDYLTEDLELHRETHPSPWEQPRITASTRERIDRLSSDDHGLDRPARRGQAPSHDEIEPPIMPSEHWLDDEPPPANPAGKPSTDKIVRSRPQMLCLTQSHRTYRFSNKEEMAEVDPVERLLASGMLKCHDIRSLW